MGSGIFNNTGVERLSIVNVDKDNKLIFDTNVTQIEANKFAGTTKFVNKDKEEIKELIIPNSITIIGNGAFSGCSSLNKISIPDSVKEIGSGAFRGCVNLNEVNLPENENFKTVQSYCFSGDTLLKSIDLPDNVTTLKDWCFSATGLNSVDLRYIESLSGWCFQGCKSLSSVNGWSNKLTKIGLACFENSGLKEIEIPDSVTVLENSLFNQCQSLKNIIVGKGIDSIPNNFIKDASALVNITFKGNIINIGEGAFENQKNFSSIEGLNWSGVRSIGSNAFKGCKALKGTISLSSECVFNEDNSFAGSGLTVKIRSKSIKRI